MTLSFSPWSPFNKLKWTFYAWLQPSRTSQLSSLVNLRWHISSVSMKFWSRNPRPPSTWKLPCTTWKIISMKHQAAWNQSPETSNSTSTGNAQTLELLTRPQQRKMICQMSNGISLILTAAIESIWFSRRCKTTSAPTHKLNKRQEKPERSRKRSKTNRPENTSC